MNTMEPKEESWVGLHVRVKREGTPIYDDYDLRLRTKHDLPFIACCTHPAVDPEHNLIVLMEDHINDDQIRLAIAYEGGDKCWIVNKCDYELVKTPQEEKWLDKHVRISPVAFSCYWALNLNWSFFTREVAALDLSPLPYITLQDIPEDYKGRILRLRELDGITYCLVTTGRLALCIRLNRLEECEDQPLPTKLATIQPQHNYSGKDKTSKTEEEEEEEEPKDSPEFGKYSVVHFLLPDGRIFITPGPPEDYQWCREDLTNREDSMISKDPWAPTYFQYYHVGSTRSSFHLWALGTRTIIEVAKNKMLDIWMKDMSPILEANKAKVIKREVWRHVEIESKESEETKKCYGNEIVRKYLW